MQCVREKIACEKKKKEPDRDRERERDCFNNIVVDIFLRGFLQVAEGKGLPFANVRSCFIRLRAMFVDAVVCRRIFGCI